MVFCTLSVSCLKCDYASTGYWTSFIRSFKEFALTVKGGPLVAVTHWSRGMVSIRFANIMAISGSATFCVTHGTIFTNSYNVCNECLKRIFAMLYCTYLTFIALFTCIYCMTCCHTGIGGGGIRGTAFGHHTCYAPHRRSSINVFSDRSKLIAPGTTYLLH